MAQVKLVLESIAIHPLGQSYMPLAPINCMPSSYLIGSDIEVNWSGM